MYKKIALIILSFIFMITASAFTAGAINQKDEEILTIQEEPEEKVVYIEKIVYVEKESFEVQPLIDFNDENIQQYTLENLKTLIEEQKEIQNNAHELAEIAREIGWPEECDAIKNAKTQWHNAQIKIDFYSVEYDNKYVNSIESRMIKKASEYPIATEIWQYMKNLGWTDYVCAGIMGNLMAECGGQTLNIQPLIQGTYYGMCQWSKTWYPEVWGQNLQGQLDFLNKTIKNEFQIFGGLYQKGFDFNQFLNLTNEKEAALAFAKCYERCYHAYYGVRQVNATTAYNYFVNS